MASKRQVRTLAADVAKMGVLPALFYLTTFIVLTYPLILRFSTHLFADPWDGFVFHWNLWWVNKAVTELSQSPWHTSYLHYPYGVSLLPHTLNVFNGFLAIPLLRFLTLIEAYNVLVIFSFTACGLTAFLLAHYFTRSYWSSVFAGFVFTFSSYHFAHMEGHLNLVSMQWIPLFVLSWFVLLNKPGVPIAIAAGLALFAVTLCDYYYFFYSVLIGVIVFVWHALRSKGKWFFLERKYFVSLIVFLLVTLATSGPLVISLLMLTWGDPISGHDPVVNSMDVLAPFIPGSHWRFAEWTRSYWSRLPGDANENSVYLGWAVVVALAYVWRRRRLNPAFGVLFFICICFAVLALGPVLHVGGNVYSAVKLPYAVLERAFPPIQASGVPVRMMIISTLAASVLFAAGLADAFRRSRWMQLCAGLAILLLVVEYLPKSRVSSAGLTPEFVEILKAQPGNGGVLDVVSDPFKRMYYQTVHEKPMAFGVLARIPNSAAGKAEEIRRLIENREFAKLHDEHRFRYLVLSASTDVKSDDDGFVRLMFEDARVKLYELGPR